MSLEKDLELDPAVGWGSIPFPIKN